MLFKAKKSTLAITLAALLLSGFGAMQAFGDDDERGERSEHGEGGEGMAGGLLTATNATFQTECSACHMAYPPGMLPAASWTAMMGTLDKHFGSDASMDKATVAEILPFLEQNAASERNVTTDKPVLRITETAWFTRQHDEISASTWKRASIKSASNCMACHTGADKGNFDEDSVRIPK
jgi:mono/diheme cytochrome c family protein